MINRQILPEARRVASQFRALCVTGPRQSGKTTLSRLLFPHKPYVNFENPTVQFEAEQHPESFLNSYPSGAIFDEIQRSPLIFRYLQTRLDENTQRGQYILTGSNNFLLHEQVSQSLAGRAGYLTLLPLSYAELAEAKFSKSTIQNHILTGGYPEIWDQNLDPSMWMNSYIQTYVQRDVRLIKNISNLATFNRFVYLCANLAGQLVNRDELAKKTGVDTKTILSWLGLLESSYIIHLLPPWYNNMNKRVIKSPKLYFYDTGLLCFLLGLKSETALSNHTSYGSIFENWVISEIRKNNFNNGVNDGMYFFRDSAGNEVDLLLEKEGKPQAIEIKSGTNVTEAMFRGLKYWKKNQHTSSGILVYGGDKHEIIDERTSCIPWTGVVDI